MNKDLKIETILSSRLLNGASVQRYSGTRLAIPESVADHVSECIGFAIMCYNIQPIFDIKEVIFGCSVHDLGECYTGDIVRPVKYSSPQMKEQLDELERVFLFKEINASLAKEIVDIKHKGTLEDDLIFSIDLLQTVFKLYREYKIQHLVSIQNNLSYSLMCAYNSALHKLESHKEANLICEKIREMLNEISFNIFHTSIEDL